MRSRHRLPLRLALLLATATLSAAVPVSGLTAERGREDAHETRDETRPEHRQRKLPDDVFKPSEEVGEDYPVPFPVDI
ncbi:MAG: hypothetical protein RLW61_03685 [Gammaproteobacteria bacterium]